MEELRKVDQQIEGFKFVLTTQHLQKIFSKDENCIVFVHNETLTLDLIKGTDWTHLDDGFYVELTGIYSTHDPDEIKYGVNPDQDKVEDIEFKLCTDHQEILQHLHIYYYIGEAELSKDEEDFSKYLMKGETLEFEQRGEPNYGDWDDPTELEVGCILYVNAIVSKNTLAKLE